MLPPPRSLWSCDGAGGSSPRDNLVLGVAPLQRGRRLGLPVGRRLLPLGGAGGCDASGLLISPFRSGGWVSPSSGDFRSEASPPWPWCLRASLLPWYHEPPPAGSLPGNRLSAPPAIAEGSTAAPASRLAHDARPAGGATSGISSLQPRIALRAFTQALMLLPHAPVPSGRTSTTRTRTLGPSGAIISSNTLCGALLRDAGQSSGWRWGSTFAWVAFRCHVSSTCHSSRLRRAPPSACRQATTSPSSSFGHTLWEQSSDHVCGSSSLRV